MCVCVCVCACERERSSVIVVKLRKKEARNLVHCFNDRRRGVNFTNILRPYFTLVDPKA